MSNFVGELLREQGHDVEVSCDGEAAIRKLESSIFDLVILDWGTPLLSGMDVLKWIRQNIGGHLPVLFLTNRVFEPSLVEALNAGADDYIVKPVSGKVLLARVNANARRAKLDITNVDSFEIGGYLIDEKAGIIYFRGNEVSLTNKEFKLAAVLFKNIGCTVPRDHIFKLLWGKMESKHSRSLDTHIYRVRQKLMLHPENGIVLKLYYTIGYRLEMVSEVVY